MTYATNNQKPLSNDQLMRIAPSIFAAEKWAGMSDRYAFIPTIQIVEALRAEGFLPFEATQSKARTDLRHGYAKHMLRFRDMRRGDAPAIVSLGGVVPELCLFNAHDGTGVYKLVAGFLRFVCMNGAVVSDGNFASINVRHSGKPEGIIEASYSVVEQFPKVLESIERFSQLRLSAPQQEVFAAAALELKYDAGSAPVTPAVLVEPVRTEDLERSLWNTFNTVQEKLISGGVKGRSASGRKVTTRRVSGVAENTRLNQALWTLTEKMADLLA